MAVGHVDFVSEARVTVLVDVTAVPTLGIYEVDTTVEVPDCCVAVLVVYVEVTLPYVLISGLSRRTCLWWLTVAT